MLSPKEDCKLAKGLFPGITVPPNAMPAASGLL